MLAAGVHGLPSSKQCAGEAFIQPYGHGRACLLRVLLPENVGRSGVRSSCGRCMVMTGELTGAVIASSIFVLGHLAHTAAAAAAAVVCVVRVCVCLVQVPAHQGRHPP